VTYELWDGELGLRLGAYGSREQALDAVRLIAESSPGSSAPLGLTVDGLSVVASGEDLVHLAFEDAR